MGWWKIDKKNQKDEKDNYIGDGPADAMGEVLDKINEMYKAEWGRDATDEEMRACFNFVCIPWAGRIHGAQTDEPWMVLVTYGIYVPDGMDADVLAKAFEKTCMEDYFGDAHQRAFDQAVLMVDPNADTTINAKTTLSKRSPAYADRQYRDDEV